MSTICIIVAYLMTCSHTEVDSLTDGHLLHLIVDVKRWLYLDQKGCAWKVTLVYRHILILIYIICSIQKTYLRLLTIGVALAAASAQLQDSNIPPAGRVARGDILSPSVL